MTESITLIQNQFPFYLLAFVRIASMFILSPIFGRKNVPAKLKIGFSIVLTILIVPLFQDVQGISSSLSFDQTHMLVFIVKIAKEMIVGMLLGFVTILFLNVALISGQVIDVAMGLGIGSVFDPQMNAQTPITGAILNTAMFLYFIIANGHLHLIKILYYTFSTAPIGQVRLTTGLAQILIDQFYLTFSLAVSLMLPVVAVTLIIEAVMGIMTRAIPQLNAYMLGIPVKIIAGFFVLLLLQPVYIGFCDKVFEKMTTAAEQIATGLGGIA